MKPSYKRRATESHRAHLQTGSLTVLHFTPAGLIQMKLSLAGHLLLPSNSFRTAMRSLTRLPTFCTAEKTLPKPTNLSPPPKKCFHPAIPARRFISTPPKSNLPIPKIKSKPNAFSTAHFLHPGMMMKNLITSVPLNYGRY